MIPIRDTIPSSRFPVVTVALIIANVLVFLLELSLGPRELQLFVARYALIPSAFTAQHGFNPERYLPLLTSMFLHGGLLHLGGNMLYLWIFGDNVEDSLGRFRFIVFYLLCGTTAGLAHVYTMHDSPIPTVGASGAIAGVLGAYFLMFPRSQVLTFVPIFIIPWLVRVPAIVFLGLWFLMQLFSGGHQLLARSAGTSGVAFMAHVGGFVAGLVLCLLFRRPAPRRPPELQPWGR